MKLYKSTNTFENGVHDQKYILWDSREDFTDSWSISNYLLKNTILLEII